MFLIEVLYTFIDEYTFRVIIEIYFLNKQMLQMLMVTLKCVLIVL